MCILEIEYHFLFQLLFLIFLFFFFFFFFFLIRYFSFSATQLSVVLVFISICVNSYLNGKVSCWLLLVTITFIKKLCYKASLSAQIKEAKLQMDALIFETNTNIKFQWKCQKHVLENMEGLKFWITGQCVVHWSNFCLVLVSCLYLIYSINKWTTHWIDQIKEL